MSISEAHGSGPHAVFADARVVELVEGAAADVDAVVRPLHSAVVRVGRERITAADGDYEWTWLVPELTEVVHGDEGAWTIFTVPGVAGFGVEVPATDRAEFRRVIEALPGVRPVGQTPPRPTPPPPLEPGEAVLDLTDEPSPGPSVFAAPPLPAPSPPPVETPDPPVTEVLDVPTGPVTAFTPTGPADAVATTPGTALKGLEARDISAWFGDHQVLDRVSLEMPPGQVTALIGPSGCGKSTFLRILNRMHEMIPGAAMAGEVLLDGQDVYDADRKLTEARKQIGMVFQKPNPFPAMSIYENVLASFRLTGRKASEGVKDEVVQRCLAKAGLWDEVKDRLRQPGGGLSGGQQQRLCIARALAIRPDVLLMDEPCSALDPTSTRRIEETIHELRTEVTVVIVTHNMQQAARVSNQCAFFLAAHGTPGVIVEHGETEAMFGSPRDQRTDDYVNGRFG